MLYAVHLPGKLRDNNSLRVTQSLLGLSVIHQWDRDPFRNQGLGSAWEEASPVTNSFRQQFHSQHVMVEDVIFMLPIIYRFWVIFPIQMGKSNISISRTDPLDVHWNVSLTAATHCLVVEGDKFVCFTWKTKAKVESINILLIFHMCDVLFPRLVYMIW